MRRFSAGADAFLLIANTLRAEELSRLIALGKRLGLDALVEVHDEEDVRKALDAKAELIGINNRDLKTLEVDLATTERLIKLVPTETPAVSESGIETASRMCGKCAGGAFVGYWRERLFCSRPTRSERYKN